MSSQQTIPLPADERAKRRGSAPALTAPPLAYASGDAGGTLVRHAGLILFGLAVLGFLARAAAIFVLHRWTQPNDIEHRQLAMSLLEHGTFYFRDFDYYGPSSVQSPPYPFLLAILFKLFGPATKAAYVAAMLINSVAGALTVWLTARFVRAIGGGIVTSLVAAALVAVWPTQVYAATHVQAIALITLCFVAIMLLFRRAVATGRLWPWVGYSVFGTLGALTEPVLLPVVAFSGLLILCWRSLPVGVRVRNAAVLLAAAMLIIMPWTVRNRRVHGRWIPIKSTFWVNTWKANNDHATGTDRLELPDEKKEALRDKQLALSDQELIDPNFDKLRQYDRLSQSQRARLLKQPEAEREAVFKEFATAWISTHKAAYARLCAVRLWKTMWVDWNNPKANNVLFWLPRSLMLVMMVPGIWMARRQRWSLLFPALVAGSCLLTYTLTIAAARFSLPLEPLALCFVALVCVRLAKADDGPRPVQAAV